MPLSLLRDSSQRNEVLGCCEEKKKDRPPLWLRLPVAQGSRVLVGSQPCQGDKVLGPTPKAAGALGLQSLCSVGAFLQAAPGWAGALSCPLHVQGCVVTHLNEVWQFSLLMGCTWQRWRTHPVVPLQGVGHWCIVFAVGWPEAA